MINLPEILAPAGSMESLEAALKAGADAVYIGGKSFSARSSATNFSLSEIEEAVKKCHVNGAKLHLAINTIMLDSEAESVAEFIKQTAPLGVDAYIIQDLAVAKLAREISPETERHASTQLTIHSLSGAEFAKENGFSRVVLARELSEEQISKITKCGLETECFVHGALCMCVSGQCYMSAMIGGRSANRGMCAQSCRLPFSSDNRERYDLSLKDLSLIKYALKMRDIGINSLKIEGRMKRPEYVFSAVYTLRNALEGKKADTDLLQRVFSRSGFTDGYYTGKRENMFGVRTQENVLSAKTAFEEIHQIKPEKKSSVDFTASLYYPEGYIYATDSDGFSAVSERIEISKASTKPIDKAYVQKQLSKLGDSIYNFGNLEFDADGDIFISASTLNKARREIIDDLYKQRTEIKNIPVDTKYSLEIPNAEETEIADYKIIADVNTKEQFQTAVEFADNCIVSVPLDILKNLNLKSKNIWIKPPEFIVDENKIISELKDLKEKGLENLVCPNVAYCKIGKDLGFKLHGSFRLNVTNSVSVKYWLEYGLDDVTVSPEMKLSQIRKIQPFTKLNFLAYGRMPLMITRNCPLKAEKGSCRDCKHILKDRTKREMRVYCYSGKDYTIIFNSDILAVPDKKTYIPKNISLVTLMFSDEDTDTTSQVLTSYINKKNFSPENHTTGLYIRGLQTGNSEGNKTNEN